MKLVDLISNDNVIANLKGSTKEEVINELVDLFKNDPRVKDIEKIRECVLEREKNNVWEWERFAIPRMEKQEL
jgi:mannitol/fructose-specific phosphotransferase system IIA component (Ntr-type)